MKVKIEELKPGVVNGVKVQLPNVVTPFDCGYFKWYPSTITGDFKTTEISGGVLETVKKEIEYSQVEYHVDGEIFYFISGECVMLFCDLENGDVVDDSIQLVRISPGTQIEISAGKGHYAPIPINEEKTKVIIACPKLESPLVCLHEKVVAK